MTTDTRSPLEIITDNYFRITVSGKNLYTEKVFKNNASAEPFNLPFQNPGTGNAFQFFNSAEPENRFTFCKIHSVGGPEIRRDESFHVTFYKIRDTEAGIINMIADFFNGGVFRVHVNVCNRYGAAAMLFRTAVYYQ